MYNFVFHQKSDKKDSRLASSFFFFQINTDLLRQQSRRLDIIALFRCLSAHISLLKFKILRLKNI